MVLPIENKFTSLLALSSVLGVNLLQETRTINDSNGNVLYFGYAIAPSADTALPIWAILKCSYDGNGFLNYIQLPNDGQGYTYIWDDVTTYF